ncbi:MAG: hypothetical protein ACYS0K_15580 [Planctomycetota bacterium]
MKRLWALATLALMAVGVGAGRRLQPRQGTRTAARPPLAERAAPVTAPDAGATAEAGDGERVARPSESTALEEKCLRFRAEIDATETAFLPMLHVAGRIAELPPDEGLRVLQAVFAATEPATKRMDLLRPYVIARLHPHSLAILHLGIEDPEPDVRGFARGWLTLYAFIDFEAHPEAYAPWRARHRGQPLAEVVRAGAVNFAVRMRTVSAGERKGLLSQWWHLWLNGQKLDALDLPGLMKGAGLLETATAWLERDDLTDEEKSRVHRWIRRLHPDGDFVRRHYLPVLQRPDAYADYEFDAACVALSRFGGDAASAALVAALERVQSEAHFGAIAGALAARDDPRWIPVLIGVIVSDDRRTRTIRSVGRALRRLTAVHADPGRDGAWWRAWWSQHRDRLPPEVRAASIPAFSLRPPG